MEHAFGQRSAVTAKVPGLRLTVQAGAPAFYALCYPWIIDLFHYAVGDPGTPLSAARALSAAILLITMFSVPAFGFVRACRGTGDNSAHPMLDSHARRLAYAVVAAPTLYCMVGVLQILVHSPVPDQVVWVIIWIVAIGWALRAPEATGPLVQPALKQLRTAHGVAALIILAYVSFHLANHLFAWIGQDAHSRVMDLGRTIYRSPFVEPILVLAMLFQVTTGLVLACRLSACRLDYYRTFQVASGLYLSVYIFGHMNSVFVLARAYFGIDTGWDFATGAPNGLIHDPWSARLIPHYALGVFFLIGHVFSGLRSVLLAHGVARGAANTTWWAGAAFAALLSTTIMLAMCGMRL